MARKPAAVSMDAELNEKAKARAQDLGFATFSAYVAQLIRSDINRGGNIDIVSERTGKGGVAKQKQIPQKKAS